MKNEKIILDGLKERSEELKKIVCQIEARLRTAPRGRLKISKRKNKYVFYCAGGDAENVSDLKYISKRNYSDLDEFDKTGEECRLAQKMYDRKALKAAKRELDVVETFIRNYDGSELERTYGAIEGIRKEMIDPVEMPWETAAAEWLRQGYEGKQISTAHPAVFSKRGEKMRSKSEVLIANSLSAAGVPYKYEAPLRLEEITVYPDFTVLRESDRKEIYWEHLGMMDDKEYAEKAIKKIEIYGRNGIIAGKGLILTYETENDPLDSRSIERYISEYF